MRAWLALPFLALGCIDFADAEAEYCREHPEICATQDGGSGGGSGVGGGTGTGGGMTVDAGNPQCNNQLLDTGIAETDVDCGGNICGPCSANKQCLQDSDCQTTWCRNDFCALVSGAGGEPTPGWIQVGKMQSMEVTGESTGRYGVSVTRRGPDMYIMGGTVTLQSGGMSQRPSPRTFSMPAAVGAIRSPLLGFNPMPNMAFGRAGAMSTFGPNGRLYVFGGATGLGSPTRSIESLNPTNDAGWSTETAQLPSNAYAFGNLLDLPDGGVLFLSPGAGLLAYNFSTFVDAGVPPPSFASSALGPNGDLYLLATDTANREVQRLAAGGSAWQVVTSMPAAHPNSSAIFAPDGRLYVAGGAGQTVDAYSPNGEWAPVAPMLDQHDSAQAIVGEDGRIYVFFGSSNTSLSMDGYSIIVEAYGPVLDTSPRQGPRGLTTKVDGTNFAANADVHIYWGHPDGGQLLKVTRSTDGGTFTQVSVKIPDAGNGPITAIDMRARYPAYIPFTVQ